MKKLVSLSIIIITLFLCLASCRSEKYPPVKSTEEEARVVMTLSLDGEKYEVKYELYRALFLSHKSAVDGGDNSVWSSSKKDEYISKINEIITSKASEIFSAFHLAQKLGIDAYSKDVDEQIKEYIGISVDNGYGGDYDAYLASLKEQGLNYSAQELLIRYSIMLSGIDEYYKGSEDEALGYIPGEYEYSEEDVRDYYFGNNSARVFHAYMQDGILVDTAGKMEEIREGLASAESDIDAALYIINNTSVTPTDLIRDKEPSGIMVGRHTFGSGYEPYTEAAFALGTGEVSEVIKTDGDGFFYVIYKLEKTEEHFTACYDDISLSYLENLIGEQLYNIALSLTSSVTFTDSYSKIVHKDISI